VRSRLGPELIDQLIQVAIQLEFYDRRPVLLLRIRRDFQSTIPMARGGRMRDQLVSDLNYLNEAGILSDGSDPLEIWLTNAIDAAGGVQEEEVFRRALAELKQPARDPDDVSRDHPDTAAVQFQPSRNSLIDEITGRGCGVPSRLALADLRPVIDVVADSLTSLSQVRTTISMSGLTGITFPIDHADARQLWIAVFQAALDAPPETFAALLESIFDGLRARPKAALDAALCEVSRQLSDTPRS